MFSTVDPNKLIDRKGTSCYGLGVHPIPVIVFSGAAPTMLEAGSKVNKALPYNNKPHPKTSAAFAKVLMKVPLDGRLYCTVVGIQPIQWLM